MVREPWHEYFFLRTWLYSAAIKEELKTEKMRVQKSTAENCKALTMQDLTKAENEIIKLIQSQRFTEGISM